MSIENELYKYMIISIICNATYWGMLHVSCLYFLCHVNLVKHKTFNIKLT